MEASSPCSAVDQFLELIEEAVLGNSTQKDSGEGENEQPGTEGDGTLKVSSPSSGHRCSADEICVSDADYDSGEGEY